MEESLLSMHQSPSLFSRIQSRTFGSWTLLRMHNQRTLQLTSILMLAQEWAATTPLPGLAETIHPFGQPMVGRSLQSLPGKENQTLAHLTQAPVEKQT